jgi:hypothetical protein
VAAASGRAATAAGRAGRLPAVVRLLPGAGGMSGEPFGMADRADRDAAAAVAGVRLVRVGDVAPERVRWLWRGRIPRGKVAVLDGDPGVGKSTITLSVAAKVTTGAPFPDGHRPEPADVLLLSAEDDIADTIRPRLEAAGADLDRVEVLTDVCEQDAPPRPAELPADLDRLEAVVKDRAAALVVVDPLMAFLAGTVDAHRDQDVRRALAPLAAMAARTGAAVVVVRHMNKGPASNPLYRGGGSIGIIGAARAGLLAAFDPDDDGRRVLAMTKSNLAAIPEALAYRLVTDELRGVAKVVWDGTTGHTAADLLRAPARDDDEAPARSEAEAFLADLLAEGPVPTRQVQAEAREAGMAWRTVERAKASLGVVAERVGKPGPKGDAAYYWRLPGGGPTSGGGATHDDVPAGQGHGELPETSKAAMSASSDGAVGPTQLLDPDDSGRWTR